MVKRAFDILAGSVALVLAFPVMVLVAVWIAADSGLPVLFLQTRVGRNGKDFMIIKFRTMREGAASGSPITIGGRDPRITRAGYFLRKYKLDELPQLFNVLKGDMSLVGPRPEVRRYVDLYTPEQRRVLSVLPGITDYASIAFVDENELLGKVADPEREYTQHIMPAKLELNLKYVDEMGLMTDIGIIWKTLVRIVT